MSITTFTEKPTDEGETEPAKSEPEEGKSNMWDILLKCYLTGHLKCYLRNAASLSPVVSVNWRCRLVNYYGLFG